MVAAGGAGRPTLNKRSRPLLRPLSTPSSSRNLLTSLPPRFAMQFPTQDNADAMADEWREEMNDFYKQKMQMRGTVAVATLA